MSNDTAAYVNVGEEYNRDTNYIEDRILDDPDARWPVEPGRYRLIAVVVIAVVVWIVLKVRSRRRRSRAETTEA